MKWQILVIAVVLCTAQFSFGQVNPGETPAQPQGQYGSPSIQDSLDIQKEDRVEVADQDLPEQMKQELKAEKYAGWENGNVFFEKNTEQYVLHLEAENGTRTYRFDKEGRPLETAGPVEDTSVKN